MFGRTDCNAVEADRSAYHESTYCCMLTTILVCGATVQIRPRPGVSGSHTDTHTHPVGLSERVIS